MTPETVRRLIHRYGETVTLRRPGSPPVEVRLKASVRGFRPDELVGGVVQGDREAIISPIDVAAAGWPAPPRKGDQVVIDGKTTTVQGAETLKIGEAPAKYVMAVRGGW